MIFVQLIYTNRKQFASRRGKKSSLIPSIWTYGFILYFFCKNWLYEFEWRFRDSNIFLCIFLHGMIKKIHMRQVVMIFLEKINTIRIFVTSSTRTPQAICAKIIFFLTNYCHVPEANSTIVLVNTKNKIHFKTESPPYDHKNMWTIRTNMNEYYCQKLIHRIENETTWTWNRDWMKNISCDKMASVHYFGEIAYFFVNGGS